MQLQVPGGGKVRKHKLLRVLTLLPQKTPCVPRAGGLCVRTLEVPAVDLGKPSELLAIGLQKVGYLHSAMLVSVCRSASRGVSYRLHQDYNWQY